METSIQIAPLRGLVLGYNFYATSHEDWYNPETDDYWEHHTFFLFIIAIRILRE